MKPPLEVATEFMTRPPPRNDEPPALGPAVSRESTCRSCSPERGAISPEGQSLFVTRSGQPGGGCDLGSTRSDQIPVRRFARRGRVGRSVVDIWASSVLCLARKLRIRSRLKAATVKPSSTVIFTPPNTRKEPPSQVDEGALQRRVHRLHDLASAHRDPPGGRAVGDALGKCQLDRGNRQDPRAATIDTRGQFHQRNPA